MRRVDERFKHAIHEVRACLRLFKLGEQLPAASATGFAELAAYLNRDLKEEQALRKWQLSEVHYAKRQDTWWKKATGLNILAADDPELLDKTLEIVL